MEMLELTEKEIIIIYNALSQSHKSVRNGVHDPHTSQEIGEVNEKIFKVMQK
jgi:hypothetical protein